MGISIFNSPFSIVNHRLMGGGVVHLVSAKNTRRLEGPDMIVLHYTAGTSAESSALFLTRPDVSASAHVVIGREGEVFWFLSTSRRGTRGRAGTPGVAG